MNCPNCNGRLRLSSYIFLKFPKWRLRGKKAKDKRMVCQCYECLECKKTFAYFFRKKVFVEDVHHLLELDFLYEAIIRENKVRP